MVKKIALMVMVVMLAVAVFTTDSNAAEAWYNCRVLAIGPSGGVVYIQLTDLSGSFTGKFFTFPAEKGKEMLAVALTAMNNNWAVSIYANALVTNAPVVSLLLYR